MEKKVRVGACNEFALQPDDFTGLVPKVVVREGDHVKAGEPLFVDKNCPDVRFASPVSGEVTAVVRGDRRKVLCVKVKADAEQKYAEFGKKDVGSLSGDEVKQALLEAGLFGYINQLPYAVATNPATQPKAIFVSALRDMPLAGKFEYELLGNEAAFQAGLTALSKMAKTYLGIGLLQANEILHKAKDVDVNIFDGRCPAGNVGVQVNHIDPVNKGEVVWTVDPSAVIFFGRLFLTGRVDLTRTVAIAGSEVSEPAYADVLVGTPLKAMLEGRLKSRTTCASSTAIRSRDARIRSKASSVPTPARCVPFLKATTTTRCWAGSCRAPSSSRSTAAISLGSSRTRPTTSMPA